MTFGNQADSSAGRPMDMPSSPSRLETVRAHRPRVPRPALRHRRSPRPSTVWPCALNDSHQGTGMIADWLLNAVVRAVTTYTQPGQRVLLLASVAGDRGSRPGSGIQPPDPYSGFLEVAWTVVRLGRGVQTRTTGTPADLHHDNIVGSPTDADSGQTPSPIQPDMGRAASGRTRPDGAITVVSRDVFDLVIIAAETPVRGGLDLTNCGDLLSTTGILAIITHGDHSRGRLDDAAGPLVTAAHRAGLRYLDRIALLRVPFRDGTSASSRNSLRASRRTSVTSDYLSQVHHDLLVFGKPPGRKPPENGGDLR